MDKEQNDKLSKKIREHFDGKVPLEWMKKTLNISRESVYRRMESRVLYSLYEALTLSDLLNFSLDELKSRGTATHRFDELQALDNYINTLRKIPFNSGSLMIVQNKLNLFSVSEFKNLFFFLVYKQIYVDSPDRKYTSFSNLLQQGKIENYRLQIEQIKPTNRKIHTIVPKNLVGGFVNDIDYFHKCNHLNDEEKAQIKEELLLFIDQMEARMRNDAYIDGNRYRYFLAFVEIEENYFLICCNERNYVLKNAKLLSTNDNYFREAYENLKSYTSPLSLLNELQRIEFLNYQRELVNRL